MHEVPARPRTEPAATVQISHPNSTRFIPTVKWCDASRLSSEATSELAPKAVTSRRGQHQLPHALGRATSKVTREPPAAEVELAAMLPAGCPPVVSLGSSGSVSTASQTVPASPSCQLRLPHSDVAPQRVLIAHLASSNAPMKRPAAAPPATTEAQVASGERLAAPDFSSSSRPAVAWAAEATTGAAAAAGRRIGAMPIRQGPFLGVW
mmetsp:Transcript_1174/g.2909  ORF Transcript_1174/g.2909 Transcript_1174/m.2909 type:complete len:208 (+) Transcript_1174:572-1195(+)